MLELLKQRYDNKRFICNMILKRFLSQKNAAVESSTFLKELIDTSSDCLSALANIGVDVSTWDAIVIHLLTLKLDQETRKQWELSATGGRKGMSTAVTPRGPPEWSSAVREAADDGAAVSGAAHPGAASGPSLRRLTSQYGFPDYNVSLLMLQLAPSCDSMLVKCAWRGKEMPCDYLFAMRVTSVGYCCVFNSRYEPYDMENPPRVLDREGKDNGLSVIYREDIDDFGLVRRPVHGIEVLIFDGMEYPLLEGGGVRVQRTQPNAVVFFKLSTRTQLASSSLSIFPEFLRGCRMKSGSSQPSYSWCLMDPRQDLVCSLDHLLCLNKHREKFLNRFPSTSSQLHLPEESVNALFCPDCQPDCARTAHTVVSNRVPFNHLRKMLRDSFTHGIKDIANISLLRFFYPTMEKDLYTLEPDEVWFERIASLSSQWVGVLGLTMVTLCELVFHCTVRWRHHYTRRMTLH
ncbi:sodium channel protein Nach-like [Choristoneura fumiferana]|uniref:sodium channel protein Nach-like n=1 Tax=Choristoneura fumiferana TaxID=7141 RepID=UPI003D15E3D9